MSEEREEISSTVEVCTEPEPDTEPDESEEESEEESSESDESDEESEESEELDDESDDEYETLMEDILDSSKDLKDPGIDEEFKNSDDENTSTDGDAVSVEDSDTEESLTNELEQIKQELQAQRDVLYSPVDGYYERKLKLRNKLFRAEYMMKKYSSDLESTPFWTPKESDEFKTKHQGKSHEELYEISKLKYDRALENLQEHKREHRDLIDRLSYLKRAKDTIKSNLLDYRVNKEVERCFSLSTCVKWGTLFIALSIAAYNGY